MGTFKRHTPATQLIRKEKNIVCLVPIRLAIIPEKNTETNSLRELAMTF